MSENQLITGNNDELLDKKNFPEINTKHSYKKIIIIISAILVAIAIAAVVIILIKRNKDEEKKTKAGKKMRKNIQILNIIFQLFNFHLILYI